MSNDKGQLFDALLPALEEVAKSRRGSGHVLRNGGGSWSWRGMWTELAATFDFAFAASLFEHHANLGRGHSDQKLPPGSLGPYFVTTLLLARLADLELWSCAYLFGGGTSEGISRPEWIPASFAEQCWVVLRAGVPIAAVDTTLGTVASEAGEVIALTPINGRTCGASAWA